MILRVPENPVCDLWPVMICLTTVPCSLHTSVLFVFPQDKVVMRMLKPRLLESDLVKAVEPILQEYLEHGDSKEAKVRC